MKLYKLYKSIILEREIDSEEDDDLGNQDFDYNQELTSDDSDTVDVEPEVDSEPIGIEPEVDSDTVDVEPEVDSEPIGIEPEVGDEPISGDDGEIERSSKEEEPIIQSYNGGITDTIDKLISGEYAKNGRKFYRSAKIWYRDKETNTLEERYVFIYGEGTTKAGNKAIRAFQAGGGTKTGNTKWKIFLTDNIKKIKVTDLKWYSPIKDKNVNIINKKGEEEVIKMPGYKGPTRDKSFLNGLEKGIDFK
jgi:hypothetical protein